MKAGAEAATRVSRFRIRGWDSYTQNKYILEEAEARKRKRRKRPSDQPLPKHWLLALDYLLASSL